MAAREIRAGKAYVELGTKDAGFLAGLRNAESALKAIGSAVRNAGLGLTAAAGAMLAPITLAVHQFAQFGSELNDIAARTGGSVEFLSGLGYAAAQTGASLADVEAGMRRMARVVSEASSGSQSAADSLGALGVSVAEIRGLSPDQTFALISRRMGEIQNPTARAAAAMEVFGKSGTKLLPMIAEMDALTERAAALGLVMSTQDAAAADALGDAFDDVKATVQALHNAIGSALAPVLTDLAQQMAFAVASVANFIRENREMVIVATQIALAVGGVGVALVAIGTALSFAGFAIGGLIAVGTAVSATFVGVGAVIAAIVSPIGLVIASMATIATAIGLHTGAINSAIEWISERLSQFASFAASVFRSIGNALRAGDLQAAANVAWAAIVYGFQAAMQPLREAWLGIKLVFIESWYDMTYSLRAIWVEFSTWMESSLTRLQGWLADVWLRNNAAIAETIRLLSSLSGNVGGIAVANQLAKVGNVNISETMRQVTDDTVSELNAERQARLAALTRDRDLAQRRLNDSTRESFEAAKRQLAEAQAALSEAQAAADAAQAKPFGALPRPADLPDMDEIRQLAKVAFTGQFGATDIGRTVGGSFPLLEETKKLVQLGQQNRDALDEVALMIERHGATFA